MTKTFEMILQSKITGPLQRITNPTSISEAIADLQKKGYQLLFEREATCLYCIELKRWITADSFNVHESYRFEDVSNPDKDRILYAISSAQGKGFLIEASFVYQDNISLEMTQKLTIG